MSRTFKLTIAYDGADFAGWQVQPGEQTIQGMLQHAMQQITDRPVQVIGSGRTDAGVHALAQVASCTLDWRDSAERLASALNANLPDTIVIRDAVDAPAGFHAIRDAIAKRYRYQLKIGGTRDPFEYRYRWHLFGAIDIDAMTAAAQRFVGRHDFAGFQAARSDRKTTTRNVLACDVIRQTTDQQRAQRFVTDGVYLAIEVEADGFLYNMVRTMVGTLVEVGRGRQPVEWIDQLIAAKNRDLAGQTAPPQGLFLVDVQYAQFGQST